MGVLSDWQLERDVKIEPKPAKESPKGVISHGYSCYGVDIRVGYIFKVFSPTNCGIVDPKNFDPKSLVEVDLTPKLHSWSGAEQSKTGSVYTCINCGKWTHHYEAASTCPTPDHVLIPPNSFALAESLEWVEVPRDCLGICLGKSTYHRCGIIVSCTPLEAEWKGKITIEIGNSTPLPAKVYAGEGIMQVIFLRSDGQREAIVDYLLKGQDEQLSNDLIERVEAGVCHVSYADKKGIYQSQSGITMPRVKKE